MSERDAFHSLKIRNYQNGAYGNDSNLTGSDGSRQASAPDTKAPWYGVKWVSAGRLSWVFRMVVNASLSPVKNPPMREKAQFFHFAKPKRAGSGD